MFRRTIISLVISLLLVGAAGAPSCAAGKYCLAFWRETGFNEKGGIGGNHVINVHVWDENGNPLPGKHVFTGTLDMGATDTNGQVELAIYEPNAYALKVVDGSNDSDVTPGFSSTRAPDWGHYCFECGFVYKSDTSNLPTFDLAYDGIFNSSSADYACNNIEMSAPRTRSLGFCSTKPDAGYYCSDAYEAGSTVSSVGQTFKATGNRVVACKFHAIGNNAQYTVRIREGGPTGPYVGTAAISPPVGTYEYSKTLTKWGLNGVPVVPGNTYFLEITKPGGTFAVNRVVNDNYPYGSYYEGTTPFSGRELRGEIVCATIGSAPGAGTISGYVRDPSSAPIAGATVATNTGGYSASSDGTGHYELVNVQEGTYSVTASRTGYSPQTNSSVTVTAGQTTTSNFTLTPNAGAITGYVRDSGGIAIAGAAVSTSSGGYSTTSAANGSYTLANVTPGVYSVTASKSGYSPQTNSGVEVTAGSTVTSNFTLGCLGAAITSQPQDQAKTVGQSAVFQVAASGTPPILYQWRKNGTNIPGARTSSYTIHVVAAGDAGSYDCVVSNSCGSQTSNTAELRVNTGVYGSWDSDKVWSAFDTPTKLSGTQWALESGTSTTENWGTSYGLGGIDVYGRNGQTRALVADNNGNTQDSSKIKYRTDGEGWTVDGGKTTAVKVGFYTIDASGAYPAIYIRLTDKGVQIRYDKAAQAWIPGSGAVLDISSPTSLPVPLQTWHYIRLQMDPAGNWQAWLNEDPSQRIWGTTTGGGGSPYIQIGCLGSTNSNIEFGLDFVAWGQDSSIGSFGAGAISGAVKDTAGDPIAGATVSTTSGGFTATTAANGTYTFSDVPCGIYDVVASKSGYSSQTESGKIVNLGQTTAVHFSLEQSDLTAPITPVVTDDGVYTGSSNSLHASWTSSDPETGIAEYQYAIGTSPGAADVAAWTSTGTTASVTRTGLALSYSQTYYVSVKARNGAGMWSDVGSSNGIRPARSVAGVADAKSRPDGEAVSITGKVVTAGFADGFYIQEDLRSAGIRVAGTAGVEGATVTVTGVLDTVDGERVITDAVVE